MPLAVVRAEVRAALNNNAEKRNESYNEKKTLVALQPGTRKKPKHPLWVN